MENSAEAEKKDGKTDSENDDTVEDVESKSKNGEAKVSTEGEKIENSNDSKPVAIENSPLDKGTVESIRAIEKGQRPDPETYMSQEMIDSHLEQFRDGGSFVMTQDQYDMFVEGKDSIGCPDNSQFMTTKDNMDEIFRDSGGDIGAFEDRLGFDRGHFEEGGGLVRIDVHNPLDLNGRLPSGNEMGANDRFIPGGYTDGPNGGSPEIVTDKIPNNDDYRTITFGRS